MFEEHIYSFLENLFSFPFFFLKFINYFSYLSILAFLYFVFKKIVSFFIKRKFLLKDMRFQMWGLTNNDGSKKLFCILLIILFISIILDPFIIDIFKVDDVNLKSTGTYSYYVESSNGNIYPAQISIKGVNSNIVLKKIIYDDCIISIDADDDNYLSLNTFNSFYDEDYEYIFNLKLLNRHAYDERIKEITNVDPLHLILFLIHTASEIFVIIIYNPKDDFSRKKYVETMLSEYME